MAKAKVINESRYSFNMVEFSKVNSMETACNLMFVICWYLPPQRVDKSESHHVTTQLRYGYSGTGSATIYRLQVPPTLSSGSSILQPALFMASSYPTPWVGVPGRSLTDRAAFETSTMPYRGSLPQSPGKVVPCGLESRASWPGKYWNGTCNYQIWKSNQKHESTVYLNRRSFVPPIWQDNKNHRVAIYGWCLVIYTNPR